MKIKTLIILLILAACQNTSTYEGELPTRFIPPTFTPRPQQSRPLPFWEAQESTLQPDMVDTWLFEAQLGDSIRLGVVGINAEIILQTQTERFIASGIDSLEVTLPEETQYRVIVRPLDSGGTYQIGLRYTDRPAVDEPTRIPEVVGVPTPTPIYASLGAFISRIEPQQTIGETIGENGTAHIYTFEGYAGHFVQIEARRVSGASTPRIALYDPQARIIATDGGSVSTDIARLNNIILPIDGLYSIQIIGEANMGYAVTLLLYDRIAPITPTIVQIPTATPIPTYSVNTPAPATFGNRLESHQPVLGFADSPSHVGIYPFYASAGEILTIGAGAANGSTVQLQMEIVDPDGVIVARSTPTDSNGDTVITPLRAELEGVYQIFVTPFNGQIGAYLIGYGSGTTWVETVAGQAIRDEQNRGVITRRGLRDTWTVELQAGDIITIAATPGDIVFDPVVEIVYADEPNTILAADDNSGGNRAAYIQRVEINRSGLYLIRVRAAQAGTLGPYLLVWRYINVAPTPTPPPATAPVMVIVDRVPESAYQFYPFQGRAGQRLIIQVEAMSEGFDPVVALIAPDGNVIAEGDDSPDSLNPYVEVVLPVDGTYQVRVNGYLTGGDFRVMVLQRF
ncbi:MAG: hypothetical protein Kow00117_14680 [Phototrophicales bacterium]